MTNVPLLTNVFVKSSTTITPMSFVRRMVYGMHVAQGTGN
jgi:hypothetical protein